MEKTKVLIVVDMQNDFINGSLGTKEAEAIVPNVVGKIKTWTGELYLTQDTHASDYLSTQEGKILPVMHCIYQTKGWELYPEIIKVCGPIPTFTKHTFGCLSLLKTLEELERTVGIEEIQLVGLCTDICIITNALLFKTYFPEIEISVDPYCCAGTTLESHLTALEAMEKCQIKIKRS